MKTFFKKNSLNPLWESLCDKIDSFGLINQVNPELYLMTIQEFSKYGPATKEITDCLYWCKDKGYKIVTIMRFRNWLNNWARRLKQEELRQATYFKDKRPRIEPSDAFVRPSRNELGKLFT